jgi:hypothetical protein
MGPKRSAKCMRPMLEGAEPRSRGSTEADTKDEGTPTVWAGKGRWWRLLAP